MADTGFSGSTVNGIPEASHGIGSGISAGNGISTRTGTLTVTEAGKRTGTIVTAEPGEVAVAGELPELGSGTASASGGPGEGTGTVTVV